MGTFFTSDTHFSHKNIIKYENRPFSTVEEMDNYMIWKWNQKIKNNDDIYILGDFVFGSGERANEILTHLNGRKYLIRGNHDSFLRDATFNTRLFQWVKDYYLLKINGVKIALFHYPIAVWDCKHHDSLHLFGHIHSDKENHHPLTVNLGRAYNVGVDVNGLEPISLEEILNKI